MTKLDKLIFQYENEWQNKSSKKIMLALKGAGFSLLGEGAYTSCYGKKGVGFVIKVCRRGRLPTCRKNSKISKFFIGYLFLSKNNKFAIQKKVKVLGFRIMKGDYKEVFVKAGIYYKYDIHGYNVCRINGKYRLIDF